MAEINSISTIPSASMHTNKPSAMVSQWTFARILLLFDDK
jgi:hypothetical protein